MLQTLANSLGKGTVLPWKHESQVARKDRVGSGSVKHMSMSLRHGNQLNETRIKYVCRNISWSWSIRPNEKHVLENGCAHSSNHLSTFFSYTTSEDHIWPFHKNTYMLKLYSVMPRCLWSQRKSQSQTKSIFLSIINTLRRFTQICNKKHCLIVPARSFGMAFWKTLSIQK